MQILPVQSVNWCGLPQPELDEGWAENKQPVAGDDGVVFYLKYLGFTLVDEVDDDESYGDGASTKAVQRIVAMVSFHSHSVVCSACSIPSCPPPEYSVSR